MTQSRTKNITFLKRVDDYLTPSKIELPRPTSYTNRTSLLAASNSRTSIEEG